MGPLGHGIHGQILFGSVLSRPGRVPVGPGPWCATSETRTLYPLAIYCFVFGLLSVIYLGAIRVALFGRRLSVRWVLPAGRPAPWTP